MPGGLTFVDRESKCFDKIGMDFGGPRRILSNLFLFSWRKLWTDKIITDENSLLHWFLMGHTQRWALFQLNVFF